jgi:CDP-glycerol glycerophosphotransferase
MKKLTISELAQTNSYKDIDNLKKDLSIDSSKKIILYAPTWRDNQHISGQGYTYDLNIDFGKLREEFGDEYIILFRAHYFISNNIDLSEYEGFVYDVSKYDDINELYVISDILITDYSSVFFDYANLKRPIMFYMYDFDEYKNNMRDFYIDIDELPGPIAKTQNELIEAIKNVETYQKDYGEKYKAFYDKYDYLDDGNASQRLLDICIK